MSWNIFSGANAGRLRRRNADAVTKSIKSARFTEAGAGRIGIPWIAGAERTER